MVQILIISSWETLPYDVNSVMMKMAEWLKMKLFDLPLFQCRWNIQNFQQGDCWVYLFCYPKVLDPVSKLRAGSALAEDDHWIELLHVLYQSPLQSRKSLDSW